MTGDDENEQSLMTSLVGQPNNLLYEEKYHPPWVTLTLILMPVFWDYHVTVTDENLSFGYSCGIAEKSAPRSQVVAAEPFDIKPLRQWGGWGIRMSLGEFQTGYICTSGPGVKVTLMNEKGKKSVYVFSCKEPTKVCDILNVNSTKNTARETS